MESISISSPSLPFSPSSKPPASRPFRGPHLPTPPRSVRFAPASAKRNWYGRYFDSGFGLVDDNMIVLRKRIREMEAEETDDKVPAHWTEWEKRYYYADYGSDVCGFVGLVQTLLMRTRPGLAFLIVALTAMSVPTSAVLIWIHLVGLLGG